MDFLARNSRNLNASCAWTLPLWRMRLSVQTSGLSLSVDSSNFLTPYFRYDSTEVRSLSTFVDDFPFRFCLPTSWVIPHISSPFLGPVCHSETLNFFIAYSP
jgi:hypothetical protein